MLTVYGPYTRADGRQVVILYNGFSRTTQSYPRYLMEKKLGRKLLPEEHVDHIDNNFRNNDPDNLQLLTQWENNRKQADLTPREVTTFICAECGKEGKQYTSYVKNNRNRGCKGPYCGRSCAGKANARLAR